MLYLLDRGRSPSKACRTKGRPSRREISGHTRSLGAGEHQAICLHVSFCFSVKSKGRDGRENNGGTQYGFFRVIGLDRSFYLSGKICLRGGIRDKGSRGADIQLPPITSAACTLKQLPCLALHSRHIHLGRRHCRLPCFSLLTVGTVGCWRPTQRTLCWAEAAPR